MLNTETSQKDSKADEGLYVLEGEELEGITSEVLLSKMEEQARKINHKSDGDRMKKGFYFIIGNDLDKDGNQFKNLMLQEGSYEGHGRLMVNRPEFTDHSRTGWKVTHIDSGAALKTELTLNQARMCAKDLKRYDDVWSLRTYSQLETFLRENPERMKEIAERVGQHPRSSRWSEK